MTLALIDKQDTFEIVRDKIAAILATEIASQQALATAAAKDSSLWKLRIFSERSNAWEQYLNSQADLSPLVNIWFDSTEFIEPASNNISSQVGNIIYNIDCFGAGVSADLVAGGFTPGDLLAASNAHRALRLVRNILMAGENTYLGLQGTVYQRWPRTFKAFQPETEQAIVDIVGVRLALRVTCKEMSPQVAAETLEYLSVTIKRSEDGEILATADFDYTE